MWRSNSIYLRIFYLTDWMLGLLVVEIWHSVRSPGYAEKWKNPDMQVKQPGYIATSEPWQKIIRKFLYWLLIYANTGKAPPGTRILVLKIERGVNTLRTPCFVPVFPIWYVLCAWTQSVRTALSDRNLISLSTKQINESVGSKSCNLSMSLWSILFQCLELGVNPMRPLNMKNVPITVSQLRGKNDK